MSTQNRTPVYPKLLTIQYCTTPNDREHHQQAFDSAPLNYTRTKCVKTNPSHRQRNATECAPRMDIKYKSHICITLTECFTKYHFPLHNQKHTPLSNSQPPSKGATGFNGGQVASLAFNYVRPLCTITVIAFNYVSFSHRYLKHEGWFISSHMSFNNNKLEHEFIIARYQSTHTHTQKSSTTHQHHHHHHHPLFASTTRTQQHADYAQPDTGMPFSIAPEKSVPTFPRGAQHPFPYMYILCRKRTLNPCACNNNARITEIDPKIDPPKLMLLIQYKSIYIYMYSYGVSV